MVFAIRAVRERCVELRDALKSADSLSDGAELVLETRRLEEELL